MAKPKTTYASVAKNKTAFSGVAKNRTSFNKNSSVSSWLLNSAVVTLNSIVYLLSGYTGATPNQNDSKNVTTYTAT